MGNSTSVPADQVIWHAVNDGDHQKVRTALAKTTPTSLEWRDAKSGRTPLAQAAAKGKYQCVVALMEHGADVTTQDDKGNSPLHLACRFGHDDIVRELLSHPQTDLFAVNLALMTPLDVVRDNLALRLAEPGPTKCVLGYEQCINDLEQKCTISTGWLYQKTDTWLSMVTGIRELTSWRSGFCVVSQTGTPGMVELAFFSMRKNSVRPALPRFILVMDVQSGMATTTDTKWVDRKEFTFELTGRVVSYDGDRKSRRQVARPSFVDAQLGKFHKRWNLQRVTVPSG